MTEEGALAFLLVLPWLAVAVVVTVIAIRWGPRP